MLLSQLKSKSATERFLFLKVDICVLKLSWKLLLIVTKDDKLRSIEVEIYMKSKSSLQIYAWLKMTDSQSRNVFHSSKAVFL